MCQVFAAAEAVNHTGTLSTTVLVLQNVDRLVFGFARVNDDRHTRFLRGAQLPAEDPPLHIARRVVVVEVETDLAPRDHAFGGFEKLLDPFFDCVVIETRIVRMNTDCVVDVIVSTAHVDRTFEDSAMRIAGTDIQDRGDPGSKRAFQHRIAIRVKLRTINVRMRVDEHRSYFNRAPFGTSSVKVAITGRPSSPYEAATTMPCDSWPRDFRGVRFATTTSLRPISFSGS